MITTVEQLLAAHPNTCSEARSWLAEKQITSLADAWDQCRRSDWMLWLDRKLDLLTDRQRRLIACKCVRETPLADGRVTWDLLTDERSRSALTVAERYASGWAPAEDLAAARAAAAAAWAAARDAARAAAWAAAAAAMAAADAADAARAAARDAAKAAADAARDAAWAAADAADAWDAARAAARVAAKATQSDLIREIAGNPFRMEDES